MIGESNKTHQSRYTPPMKKWYLIYTKVQQEKKACQHLQNQGYDVYLPLIKVEKLRQGARVMVEEPLFARYVFVRLDEEGSQSWAPIRSTIGVSRLVKFGQFIPCLSQEVVDWMVQQTQACQEAAWLEAGDVVQITEGPFKGLEAVFQTYDGEKRAVLLLTLLARATPATLDLTHLKKTSQLS